MNVEFAFLLEGGPWDGTTATAEADMVEGTFSLFLSGRKGPPEDDEGTYDGHYRFQRWHDLWPDHAVLQWNDNLTPNTGAVARAKASQ